jgi:hypothetical protein
MLLSSLVISWKYLHDKTYSSRAWSKITGLTAPEVSNNEMVFLRDLLDWDMFVDRAQFWAWSFELEKAAWSAASMREVRREKRESMPEPGQSQDSDIMQQIDDGSVRNYSASNLIYFKQTGRGAALLPMSMAGKGTAVALTRAASFH